MDYVQRVDFDAVEKASKEADKQASQFLVGLESGFPSCSVRYIQTPPGGGSPTGMHTHDSDQIFYVLRGRMNIEVDGESHLAEPGTLVIFPKGVPHRNWNAGDEPTVHLSINVPAATPH